MAFETLTRSLTEAGLAPEVVTQLVANEKAAQTLQSWHEGGLRQSDYDRKMNAGKAEIEAKKAELQEQVTTFEAQKAAINKQYMDGIKTAEQAKIALDAVRRKAESQSAIYGVDLVKDLFDETTSNIQVPNRQPDPRNDEPSGKFEKRMEMVESLVPGVVDYTTEMLDVARQHAELFPDKPLVFKDLLKEAKDQRRSPTAVWDDKFGATAKREEIKADKYRAEGAAKAKEDLEKKYSGMMVNGVRTDIPMSPIFQTAANKNLSAPKDKEAGRQASIQGAVEALASGKYRQGARRAEQ
jgi:hypothetical protein